MSRNIVPRTNKGADLGTPAKNWNKLYADAVILRGSDLKALLDGKTDLDTLTAKGDLYVATDAGTVTRLPRGTDGYLLRTNSLTLEGLEWQPGETRQALTANVTITVGDGGDFSTINQALSSAISLYYPAYVSGIMTPYVTIKLLSGFVMNEQVLIRNLNLSWITITGEDIETTINRSSLTTYFGGGYCAFNVSFGGFLPIIGQLFNMDTTGTGSDRHGIGVNKNSRAIILSGCGVKNAGERGLFAMHASTADANGANFDGAGVIGMRVYWGSFINATNAIGTVTPVANTLTPQGIIFKE